MHMTHLHLRLPLHLLHLEHQLLLHSCHLLLVLLLGRELLGRVCILRGQGMGSHAAAARPPSSRQLSARLTFLSSSACVAMSLLCCSFSLV